MCLNFSTRFLLCYVLYECYLINTILITRVRFSTCFPYTLLARLEQNGYFSWVGCSFTRLSLVSVHAHPRPLLTLFFPKESNQPSYFIYTPIYIYVYLYNAFLRKERPVRPLTLISTTCTFAIEPFSTLSVGG